ncbi:hypothetical protein C7Q42_13445 [Staphylococcus aureus]|nr:hypothetical protein C7Q42_13445 [Staphylococcus aureus]
MKRGTKRVFQRSKARKQTEREVGKCGQYQVCKLFIMYNRGKMKTFYCIIDKYKKGIVIYVCISK